VATDASITLASACVTARMLSAEEVTSPRRSNLRRLNRVSEYRKPIAIAETFEYDSQG
jgi:hypothetical protein